MGLLGRAFAGLGAGVAALSGKYIDEELQANKAKMLADLQFEGAKRLDEYNLGDARQAKITAAEAARARAVGTARNETELAGKVAEASNTGLRDAQIANTNAVEAGTVNTRVQSQGILAKAKAEADRQALKDAGADTEFLAAQGKIKLADPEVAARIAASRASAASAYASAGHSNAATEGVRLANADKKKLDGLYNQASAILTDPTIADDATRAKQLAKVERQIVMMKSKTGQVAARDPELDTQTVVDEKMNPDGTTTKTTRKEVRRPGERSPTAQEDPVKAAMDAARAAKAPKPTSNSAPPVVPAAAPQATGTPIERMDDRTLKRLAETPGHANQRAARAEMERRASQRQEIDTSGPGFGNFGA